MAEQDGAPPDAERRRADRERAYLGAELWVADAEVPRMAIVKDSSEEGLQLLTTHRLETDAAVEAEIVLEDEPPMRVTGRVVRAEPLEGFDGPWRWRVALQLEEPCPKLVEWAALVAAREREIYG